MSRLVSKHGDHEPMQFRCSLVTDSWQIVVVPSWHAIWAGTFLRARSSALHHRQLLSAGAAAGRGTAPRSVRESSGAGAAGIPVCSGGLRSMPEHFHLLISEPERANPSVVIQALKLGVTRRILAARKRRERKQPSLWQDSSSHRIWQARFYDYNVWSGRKRVEKLR